MNSVHILKVSSQTKAVNLPAWPLLQSSGDIVRGVAGRVAETTGHFARVGHPEPLRTVIDVALSQYDVVWAAGGHPHCVFPTNYDELLRITGGEAADIGN